MSSIGTPFARPDSRGARPGRGVLLLSTVALLLLRPAPAGAEGGIASGYRSDLAAPFGGMAAVNVMPEHLELVVGIPGDACRNLSLPVQIVTCAGTDAEPGAGILIPRMDDAVPDALDPRSGFVTEFGYPLYRSCTVPASSLEPGAKGSRTVPCESLPLPCPPGIRGRVTTCSEDDRCSYPSGEGYRPGTPTLAPCVRGATTAVEARAARQEEQLMRARLGSARQNFSEAEGIARQAPELALCLPAGPLFAPTPLPTVRRVRR
jgi:hypothetical protein